MKRGLSLCVALVLMLVALSVGALPVSAETDGYYMYAVYDGEVTIIDVDTSISGDVVIPDTLGGYPVTSVGNYAFCYCSNITSVIIPDGVTTIGHTSFRDCTGLTSVAIPDGVTSIGNSAFRGCSSLTRVALPDSVTSIGDYAFRSCQNLVDITFGNRVASIGYGSFSGCSNLSNVYYRGGEADRATITINGNTAYLTDATWYYHSCIGSANHIYDNACDAQCNVCGDVREVEATYTPGDIDGDGSVNNRDAITLTRYLNEWGVNVVEAALDIDGDGFVNNRDVMTLTRYLNDWDVILK